MQGTRAVPGMSKVTKRKYIHAFHSVIKLGSRSPCMLGLNCHTLSCTLPPFRLYTHTRGVQVHAGACRTYMGGNWAISNKWLYSLASTRARPQCSTCRPRMIEGMMPRAAPPEGREHHRDDSVENIVRTLQLGNEVVMAASTVASAAAVVGCTIM